jgi:undecaprenyl-diphosphatase
MIVLILLIGFSRMYLGVHTPADVITSWILGHFWFWELPVPQPRREQQDFRILLNLFFLAISILLVVFTELSPVGVGEAAKFAAEGVTNAYTILGVAAAFPIVWYLDAKKLKYDVKAVWWAQILKCLLGVAIVFGLRIGLKPCLRHWLGVTMSAPLSGTYSRVIWRNGLAAHVRFWGRLGRQRGNNLH